MNELVKQQKIFEKHLDEINILKVPAEEFMLEGGKSLEEGENWVKLQNKAVLKDDFYVEEIKTRLNYITKLEKEGAMEQKKELCTKEWRRCSSRWEKSSRWETKLKQII